MRGIPDPEPVDHDISPLDERAPPLGHERTRTIVALMRTSTADHLIPGVLKHGDRRRAPPRVLVLDNDAGTCPLVVGHRPVGVWAMTVGSIGNAGQGAGEDGRA